MNKDHKPEAKDEPKPKPEAKDEPKPEAKDEPKLEAKDEPPFPTPGRIVLYVLDHGPTRGAVRPAVAVDGTGHIVHLHVFLRSGDAGQTERDAKHGTEPGCYFWPPRA
jgi:DedD protein